MIVNLPDVLDVEPVELSFAPVAGTVFRPSGKRLAFFESRMTGMAHIERAIRLVHPAKHLLDRRGVEHPHLIGQTVALVAHPVPLLIVETLRLTASTPRGVR